MEEGSKEIKIRQHELELRMGMKEMVECIPSLISVDKTVYSCPFCFLPGHRGGGTAGAKKAGGGERIAGAEQKGKTNSKGSEGEEEQRKGESLERGRSQIKGKTVKEDIRGVM